MNLRCRGPGGGLTIDEYIDVYYLLNTEKVGSQILTNAIQILGLKSILLALGRIPFLASLHQASRPMMFYAVECMRPTIYDWSTTLLIDVGVQLIFSLVLEENELDSYINEEVPFPEEDEANALHKKKLVMAKMIISDSIKDHLIP